MITPQQTVPTLSAGSHLLLLGAITVLVLICSLVRLSETSNEV
jgi:hypothetical protein